ncbi:MAG: hypothetical protein EXR72_04890 [Myxococcales bacterium]|nr:hypothetical protein [Myxococcales bacterium]
MHDELKARLATAPPPEVAVHLDWQSCFGKCARGVNVMVRELRPGEGEEEIHRSVLGSLRGGVIYNAVTPGDVPRIVAEHVVGGRVIGEFRNRDPLP